ncbi:putative toxin-antitoxin system toxin component, PIN family [Candidatus Kuenenbacteria bacterium CG1_02_38_13]|uniref:Putative toxin-antitoxin system toxin component, PIN family n=1 Tax=Candidatus Kuenenbacteria bacterium CG1_02_38_13 TaxID=1805235 RepID=A0A1J4TXF9_9BACT|nr:MAG: putative toxin-antitoxin system toxin component, PIN family [Candidatus Kuenenbacteria bacterium CG1_02_38_13]
MSMKRISLVFIDTNIWFSAFYKTGTCSQLITKLREKEITIAISELVLAEIINTFQKKLPQALSLVSEYLQFLKVLIFRNPEKHKMLMYSKLVDKNDLPILVSAIENKCQYLITGNLKDFTIKKIKKVTNLKVVSPMEMMKIADGR